jgi:hypothetical protein
MELSEEEVAAFTRVTDYLRNNPWAVVRMLLSGIHDLLAVRGKRSFGKRGRVR